MHIVYATLWLSKIRKTEHFSSWKVNLSLSWRAKDKLLTNSMAPDFCFGVQIRSVGISLFSHGIPRLVNEWINSDEPISILETIFFGIECNRSFSKIDHRYSNSKHPCITISEWIQLEFICYWHQKSNWPKLHEHFAVYLIQRKKSYTSIQSIAFYVDICVITISLISFTCIFVCRHCHSLYISVSPSVRPFRRLRPWIYSQFTEIILLVTIIRTI